MTDRKRLKPGDRVRLKGYSYSGSYVEGKKGRIVTIRGEAVFVDLDLATMSVQVHPSQVRRLVRRKRREWAGHWVRQFTNTGKVEHIFRPENSTSFPYEITPMRLREVPKPRCHMTDWPPDAMGACTAKDCPVHGKGK